jgi:hypothetical protein
MTNWVAVRFREISLSIEILSDPAKRTYVDTRLETDRKRKEKYAQSDKKRKDMIDVRPFSFSFQPQHSTSNFFMTTLHPTLFKDQLVPFSRICFAPLTPPSHPAHLLRPLARLQS